MNKKPLFGPAEAGRECMVNSQDNGRRLSRKTSGGNAARMLRIFALFSVALMLISGFQPGVNNLMTSEELSHDVSPDSVINPSKISSNYTGITKADLDSLIMACNDTTDTDGDLIPDSVELVLGTDWNRSDSDGDRLDDNYEIRTGLNPMKVDSNGDGLSDYMETFGGPMEMSTGWENGTVPDARVTASNDASAKWGLTDTRAFSGNRSFFLNGSTNGDMNGDQKQFFFIDILNVSIDIRESTRLTFRIYHDNGSSPNVALDGTFSDGTTIRKSGLKDQYGTPADPNERKDPIGIWYLVEYDLSSEKGKTLTSIGLSYSHDGPLINERFSVFLDDVMIWESDFDGDGKDNFEDDDNDNDGVPDSLDLSVYASTGAMDSFDFSVNLDARPTYMDFQVIPENREHMKYTGTSWDWPDDSRAQMKDLDSSKDDVSIQPMMELTMDQVPDSNSIKNYGMAVKRSFIPDSWSGFMKSPYEPGIIMQGGGMDVADINGNGIPDLVLMGIDNPEKSNKFWYIIGWDLDSRGNPSGWSDTFKSPDIGYENQGGGLAIGDIDGNGIPDLVLMGIDNPEKSNKFWYMVGWNLDSDGKVESWSNTFHSPDIGYENQGGGLSIGDIDGNGKPDLLFTAVDNPDGANRLWYMVGWNLDSDGKVESWSNTMKSPEIGDYDDGGGVVMGDIDGNGKPDLLFTAVDDPKGPNSMRYIVGWDMDKQGEVSEWSRVESTDGVGDTNYGGGIALADIDGNGEKDIILMTTDYEMKPKTLFPEGRFSYKIGWNLKQRVYAPLWPVEKNGDMKALQGRAFLPGNRSENINVSASLVWMVTGHTDSYNLKFLKGNEDPGPGWHKIDTPIYGSASTIYMWARSPMGNQIDIVGGTISSPIHIPDGYVIAGENLDSPLDPFVQYLIVKDGLQDYINISTSHTPPDSDWTLLYSYACVGSGGMSGFADGRKYIYIRNAESPFISSEPVNLAVYHDRESLSGFSVTQSYGTTAGIFYSDDLNATLGSYAVLNYDFLWNDTDLFDAPERLKDYGLEQAVWTCRFSHMDAAAVGISDEIHNSLKDMPSHSLMPVTIMTDSYKRMTGLGSLDTDEKPHIDMRDQESVRSRNIKMLWVDTDTGDPASMQDIVDEVWSWTWMSEDDRLNATIIMLAWNAGDFDISIGSEPIDFSTHESGEVLEEMHDGYDAFEQILSPILEDVSMVLSASRLSGLKYDLKEALTKKMDLAPNESEELDRLNNDFKMVHEAENADELKAIMEAEDISLTEDSRIGWMETGSEVLEKVSVFIAVVLAIWSFYEIASAEDWSAFGVTLGAIVAGLELLYFGILFLIAFIPVVGWVIDLVIIFADIIATIFQHGSGWIISQIVQSLVNIDIRTKIDLDTKETHLYVEDRHDNGLTAGDRIVVKSRIVEHVKATDRGSSSDVSDSYIVPNYHVKASSCGGNTKTGTFSNVLYEDYGSKSREVGHEVGVWVEPGEARINFAITTHIHVDYRVDYDKCVCGICSEDDETGSENSNDATTYFDILPDSLDGFLSWSEIKLNDRDLDGLKDNEEGANGIYYLITQNSTGRVLYDHMLDRGVGIGTSFESPVNEWSVEENEWPYIRIVNRFSKKALSSDGKDVIVETPGPDEHQKWGLRNAGYGHWYLVNIPSGDWLGGSAWTASLEKPSRSDSKKWSFTVTDSTSKDTVWDTDGDGLSDAYEADNFFIYGTDPTNPDSDGDGLSDALEIRIGTSPNNNDTDGDGLTDFEEHRGWAVYFRYGNHTFEEQVHSNPLSKDSDGDGLTDREEYERGLNPESVDTNGDGIGDADSTEGGLLLTAPGSSDSDSDGLTNLEEEEGSTVSITNRTGTYNLSVNSDIWLTDSDFDGISDAEEYSLGLNPRSIDTDGDGLTDSDEIRLGTDPTDWDTDGDGLGDAEELDMKSDPFTADTDGDGLNDSVEISMGTDPGEPDTDGDSLEDAEEAAYGGNVLLWDTDGDGLSDGLEARMGTSVNNNDTDGDGLSDGYEMKIGLNMTSNDTDGDGLSDGYEIKLGSDPFLRDTDGDGIDDGEDHDMGTPYPGNIVLVTDGSADAKLMGLNISRYTGVNVVNYTTFLSEYSMSGNIILVGNPDSTDNGTWGLMRSILEEYGRNTSSVAENGFDRVNVAYGVWTPNQTVLMISHVHEGDAWMAIGMLRSRTVSSEIGFMSAEYHSPQQAISLEAEHSTNSHVGAAFDGGVTPTVVVKNRTEHRLKSGFGLENGDRALGQYLDYRIYENGSELSSGMKYTWVIMYYNISDMKDVNESDICVYYYDESAGRWVRVTEDMDWVNEIRLNTTDISVDGRNYSGFIAVNVSRTGTFALAEEGEKEPVNTGALMTMMLLMILALLGVAYRVKSTSGRHEKRENKEEHRKRDYEDEEKEEETGHFPDR